MNRNYFFLSTIIFLFSSAASAQPLQIVITEFMANPAAVADASGEWLEIVNTTSLPIDINGWHIKDNGTNNHTINNGGPLMMNPGATFVLANNSDSTTNGGIMVDYTYSSFSLTNTNDEIILTDFAGAVIDSVVYTSSTSGKSWNLDPTHYNTSDNDNFTYWCLSTTPYGLGDLGTPGMNNISCVSGIPSVLHDNNFSIYTSENDLLVHWNASREKQSWDIIDITGRVILSGITSGRTDDFSIPLNGFAAGMYLFRMIGEGRAAKFMVD